jgi:hypothetical protein
MPIDKAFAYHAPSASGIMRIQAIREAYSALKTTIEQLIPEGRPRSMALTELEASAMWATKGIVFGDPESKVSTS